MSSPATPSEMEEALVILAPALHNRVSARLPTKPLSERFNGGDRRIIIEYYGLEVIELSRVGKLCFVGPRDGLLEKGIDKNTEKYFSIQLSGILAEQTQREGMLYDSLAITRMIMGAFRNIPMCKTFYLSEVK